jgi:integrase
MGRKPTPARERIAALLAEPNVTRWYKDHSVTATARTQLEQLDIFLTRTKLATAAELLALARTNPLALQDRVAEFMEQALAQGYSQKYSLNLWWGARSFLNRYGAAPAWNPKPKKIAEEAEGGEIEIVPTLEQMRQIVSALPTRARAAALLIATSGIRVGVLGGQYEAEGLRLRHLPELKLNGEGAPTFERTPFVIQVPAHLSKTNRSYLTFSTAEAADALCAYLRVRKESGEKLQPSNAVIAPDPRGGASGRRAKDGTAFVSRKSLAFTIADPMRRVAPPGVYWHAYTLRKWFSTQMESAESRGLITRTRREYFMGHSGGVDTAYNLDNPKSAEKIEELRAAYKRCEPFLSTQKSARQPDEEDLKKAILSVFFSEEELAGLDVTRLSAQEIRAMVADRIRGSHDGPTTDMQGPHPTFSSQKEPSEGPISALVTGSQSSSAQQGDEGPDCEAPEEVVTLAEVKSRLASGWTLVSSLGNGEAVLRRPH